MRTLPLTLAAVAAGTLAHAQNARPTIQLEPGAGTFTPAIASGHDLSAVLITDSGDVRISVSDGRGTAWTTPVSITSGGATFTSTRSDNERMLQVVGNTIYAIWQDNRNDNGASPAENDLYFARSTDGGQTFSTDVPVPKGAIPGVGALRDFRFRVAPGANGGQDVLYVLQSVDITGNDPVEQLYLAVSEDGGATFLPAVLVKQGDASIGDVDEIGFDVDGDNVYVAFVDNRAGADDVYFQSSTDRGQTWEATDRVIDGGGAGVGDVSDNNLEVEVAGTKVAVAWGEEPTGSGNEVLQLTVSNDSGATFGPVIDFGNYTPVTDDIDGVEMEMAADGRIYITWEDNRNGVDNVFVAVTTDDGATITETAVEPLTEGAFPQVVLGEGDQAYVQWTSDDGTNESIRAVFTNDGGLTFSSPVVLTTDPLGGDPDFSFAAVNPLYDNLLVIFEQSFGGDETIVGGFRPQTLDVTGFVAGPTSLAFDLSNFPASNGVGAVLASFSTGDLLLPESSLRNLGIGFDALTDLFLTLPFAGLTGGAGSIGPITADLPGGLTWSFVALGIDTTTGSLTFGEITDVQTLSN